MKKKLCILLIILVTVSLVVCFVACGNKNDEDSNLEKFETVSLSNEVFDYDGCNHMLSVEGVPEGAEVEYSKAPTSIPGRYDIKATISKSGYKTKTLNATMTINMPTGEQLEEARKDAIKEDVVGYDFNLSFQGNINLGFFNGKASAIYNAKYRYNRALNSMQFYRDTSGLLLANSKEYIVNSGDNKMKIKLDYDTEMVKSSKVVPSSDVELDLINIPFEKLVDSLVAQNYTNISLNTNVSGNDYMFKSSLNFSSNNTILNMILNYIKGQGTEVNIGEAKFTNPINGITIYFNLDSNMKLLDFAFAFEIDFPIKGIPVSLSLSYSQKASNSVISIPSTSDFITSTSDINSAVSKINNALLDIKDDSSYSLDVTAINEFDPGWKVTATVDKYFARMYKNTYKVNKNDEDDFVAFNHSFKYKAHHEEDGKETYNFNYGNLEGNGNYNRGDVYLISRKGSNSYQAAPAVNVNTQFEYLTNPFVINTSDIDCIQVKTKGKTTTYEISLTGNATRNIQNEILSMVNSNPADGVIKVDNYISSNAQVKDSLMTVVITNNKLVSISTNTKLKYFPTAGDYMESRITLDNELTLLVNNKLSTATSYNAPEKADGTIVGLCAAKYFIL